MNRDETIVKKWFKDHSWDEIELNDIKELLSELKKARTPKAGPYCHGEPMQRCERYLAQGGYIVAVYRCMYCHRKEEVAQ